MKVVFSNRAYAAVLAETTEKIKTETGGLFLGAVQDDVFYIVEAIDPGPKSIFEVAYFEYDQQYTQHLINKVANLYRKKLTLIGLWHRHPGSFDHFSSTDDGTNAKYASMRQQGAVSALVNIDPTFRLTVYHVEHPCRYSQIPYDVGNHLIPDEFLELKSPEDYLAMMDRMLHGGAKRTKPTSEHNIGVNLESFVKLISPLLAEYVISDLDTAQMSFDAEAQEKVINEVMDDLSFITDKAKIEVSMSLRDNALVMYQEANRKTTSMYFGYSEQKNSVVVSCNGKCYEYKAGRFKAAFMRAMEKHDNALKQERVSPRKNGIWGHVAEVIRLNVKSEE